MKALDGTTPGERGQQALARIKERFGLADLPPAFERLALADYGLHDIAMNLNRMLRDDALPERTKLLVGLGVATALGSAAAADFFAAAAIKAGRSQAEVRAAISLATAMGFYNSYVRFRHQLPDAMRPAFEGFRPGLNAESMRESGFDDVEKEAICVAVSSVNYCTGCVESHVEKARKSGMSDQQIDECLKVVAVAMPMCHALMAMN